MNTSAASAEQVFTPPPAGALSKTPVRAPPDRPRPARSLVVGHFDQTPFPGVIRRLSASLSESNGVRCQSLQGDAVLSPLLRERQNLSRARRGIPASSPEIGEESSGRGPRTSSPVRTQASTGRAVLPLSWGRGRFGRLRPKSVRGRPVEAPRTNSIPCTPLPVGEGFAAHNSKWLTAQSLALCTHYVYHKACHPHVLSVMPRATSPPSQPPPASHISRYAACRFPVHSGSSDKLPRSLRRRAPRARQRLTAHAACRRPAPEPPARPKNPLQTVSRQPDPLWGSGWRETVPPFTPTNSPTTPRLVGRPSPRSEPAESASETPRRMISAGFPGDR